MEDRLAKLLKTIARKGVEGDPIYRYEIRLSQKVIEELGWDKVNELNLEIEGNTLKVKPKRRG